MESNEQTIESLLRAEYQQWGVRLEKILQETLQTSLSFSLSKIEWLTPSEILQQSFSNNVFVIINLSEKDRFLIGIDFSRSSLHFFLDQMLGDFVASSNEIKSEKFFESYSMTLLEKRLISKIISLIFESFFCSWANSQHFEASNESQNNNLSLHSSDDPSFYASPQNKAVSKNNEMRQNENVSIFISDESIPNWILQESKRIVSYQIQFADQTDILSFYLDRVSEEMFFPQLFSKTLKSQNESETKFSLREIIVEIGQIKISSEKLASLKTGDILKTDIPANSPFFIKWDNVIHFSGKPGLFQGVPSIQIEKEL